MSKGLIDELRHEADHWAMCAVYCANPDVKATYTNRSDRSAAAAARIAELEGDPRLKLPYSVGCGPETICAMLREEDAKAMAGDISAASGMVMWVKNHAALTPPTKEKP